LPDRRQADRGSGEDDVRHQPDQLRCVNPREFGIAGIPTNVDAEILTFGPSQLAQSSREGRQIRLEFRLGRRRAHKHPYASHAPVLLRPRHHRPRRRAAKPRDELSPSHPSSSQAVSLSRSGLYVWP
jgi:hypothetical protein